MAGTDLEASKIPFLYLQEADVSGGSNGKGGDIRPFVPILKQDNPGLRATWLGSSIRSGALRSLEPLLLSLRVPGTRLCYFSTEDSAPGLLGKRSWDSVAVYIGEL